MTHFYRYKHLLFFVFCFLLTEMGFSTHNRAGEISYRYQGGLAYEITVTTYTDINSCAADRCELEIHFGDGDVDTILRSNGGPCPNGCGDCDFCGVDIGNSVKKNVYKTTHVYSGAGIYTISLEDPNRNNGILNIPNSVNTTFYLESQLIIAPGLGSNVGPELSNPPIDMGCVGLPFLHNPGAVDQDGDSLAFSLIPSKVGGGNDVPGYVYPNQVSGCQGTTLNIDPQTGTLLWDAPQCQGEYNVAILIEEFRNGFKIGAVLRDMQITIVNPCPNDPPDIKPIDPICVLAGDTVNQLIIATDPNFGDIISLTASGEPLELNFKPAVFTEVFGPDSIWTSLYWETDCKHVRPGSYQLTLRAEDDHPNVPLVDFETMEIRVIAPGPENFSGSPQGNSINLTWDASICDNASCYRIYRRIDSTGYVPDSCETGVPNYLSYTLIASLDGYNTNTYTDNDPSLTHGQVYCYLVVACFSNGAQSQASQEICLELKKDIPIITHVSVGATNNTSGIDTLSWARPTELDTIQFPGPYQINIYHSTGFSGANQLVYSSGLYQSISLLDTTYIHANINTQAQANNYRIEFLYATDQLVGETGFASSVYVSSSPTDNQLDLSWQENVPWNNSVYHIYKDTSGLMEFALLDSVELPFYSDTGLYNGTSYCYYVKSFGRYTTTGIIDPIINYSQIHCNIPVDNVAPCTPKELDLSFDCEKGETLIIWNQVPYSCSDDVMAYNLYYTPKVNQQLGLFQRLEGRGDTNYFFVNQYSIAGCYSVTALDTFNNESGFSDTVCLDNCPLYVLPNVFSPGSDGYNDKFVPFPYRNVHSIDINIYNRWGERVFQTSDPDINWDGKNANSGVDCYSGVYFYVCTVNVLRLSGIEQERITGNIQLIRDGSPVNNSGP